MKFTLARIIATYAYVGYLRPAPGTWGSLLALPLAYALASIHPILFVVAIPVAFLKGWVATAILTKDSTDHDPSEIVIDEVVGQWIALLPVVLGAAQVGAPLMALWPGWIVAFAAFRIFDIWKPLIVGAADRRGDALGVMLDDVFAGIMAAGTVVAFAALAHMVLV